MGYPRGVIVFGEEEAAMKSMEILRKSGECKDVRLKGVGEEKVEEREERREGKSDIFSRFG